MEKTLNKRLAHGRSIEVEVAGSWTAETNSRSDTRQERIRMKTDLTRINLRNVLLTHENLRVLAGMYKLAQLLTARAARR